jgi:IMP dehydrogenase
MAEGHSSDRYGHAVKAGLRKVAPEGIEGRVPYKGSLESMVPMLMGGVRSGMGYCGVKSISELQKKAKFTRVTQHGFRESHVHDLVVTKEAPNYRLEE